VGGEGQQGHEQQRDREAPAHAIDLDQHDPGAAMSPTFAASRVTRPLRGARMAFSIFWLDDQISSPFATAWPSKRSA